MGIIVAGRGAGVLLATAGGKDPTGAAGHNTGAAAESTAGWSLVGCIGEDGPTPGDDPRWVRGPVEEDPNAGDPNVGACGAPGTCASGACLGDTPARARPTVGGYSVCRRDKSGDALARARPAVGGSVRSPVVEGAWGGGDLAEAAGTWPTPLAAICGKEPAEAVGPTEREEHAGRCAPIGAGT